MKGTCMMNKKKKFYGVRRHFLQAAGAGLIACGLKIGNVAGASKNKTKFKVLDKDDLFDIGDRGKDIIQKAHDLGFEYDRFLHFSAAFFALIIFLLLWLPVMKINGEEIKKRKLLICLFLILFTSLFLWEILQYSIDQIFGTKLFFDTEQEIRIDFLEDILFGTCGLLIAVFYINYSFKKFLLVLK